MPETLIFLLIFKLIRIIPCEWYFMLQNQTNEDRYNQLVSDARNNDDKSVFDVMANNDLGAFGNIDGNDKVGTFPSQMFMSISPTYMLLVSSVMGQ